MQYYWVFSGLICSSESIPSEQQRNSQAPETPRRFQKTLIYDFKMFNALSGELRQDHSLVTSSSHKVGTILLFSRNNIR